MKKFLIILIFSIFTIPASALSDNQIKQAIIKESIAAYPGRCPCPYSSMKNGRPCGNRSAYSKPGGYETICFPQDITAKMVADYKKIHNIK